MARENSNTTHDATPAAPAPPPPTTGADLARATADVCKAVEHLKPTEQLRVLTSAATLLGVDKRESARQAQRPPQQQTSNRQQGGR